MSRNDDNAVILQEVLEANPGLLMQYPEWAEVAGLSLPATQRAYQLLCQQYPGVFVTPCPYNGYQAGFELEPSIAAYEGRLNQLRHWDTRTNTNLHGWEMLAKFETDRARKRQIRNLVNMFKAVDQIKADAVEAVEEIIDELNGS